MKTITLRKIPEDILKILSQKAAKDGIGYSKAVVKLLEESLGAKKTKKRRVIHHDLDSFAGTWTKAEAADFEKALKKIRRIDPELWKPLASPSKAKPK